MGINLFDVNYYRAVNPDLRGMNDTQALKHFQQHGLAEGRQFSALVDLNFYRAANSDLASFSNKQAYEHLQNHGVREGRRLSKFVDLGFYRTANSDLAPFNNQQLFEHLQSFGLKEGRRFSSFVNLDFYRNNNSDLASFNNGQLLSHLQNYGVKEGRRFSSFFDLGFYRRVNGDLAPFNNEQLLDHLQNYGINEGRLFSEALDINYYKSVNPDLVTARFSNQQLYSHFQTNGLSEGRASASNFKVKVYLANNPDLQAAGYNYNQAYEHFIKYGQNEGRAGGDYAGNSIQAARTISVASTNINLIDFVGNGDTDDYYRFTLSNTSGLNLNLNGLSGDVNIQLFNSNGVAIASSNNTGASNELINATLLAGDYYVRVYTPGSDSTHYNLAVNTTPLPFTISNFAFSGNEGDAGTFQLKLNAAPSSNVTVTFNTGDFLTVDTDGNITSSTQNFITFTPSNWNQAQTIKFIAECDGSAANRVSGNAINYTFSGGGLNSTGTIDLGTIVNTYAPDPNRFNIDLDFRNDNSGFWTESRKAIARKAASDWADRIANEFNGFALSDQSLNMVVNGGNTAYTYKSKRYVDDIVIFVGTYDTSDGFNGRGGVYQQLGGGSTTGAFPRVGFFNVNTQFGYYTTDQQAYYNFSHIIGHALGLVNRTTVADSLIDKTNNVFTGAYARAANNGVNVPMAAQETPGDYGHPASYVSAVMANRGAFDLTAPTAIDFGMLADIGYSIRGVNA